MDRILLTCILVFCGIIVFLQIVLLFKAHNKSENNSKDVMSLEKQIAVSGKRTDDRIEYLSSQMNTLTNKNYEQKIDIMNTLNINSEKQANIISNSIAELQKGNEEKLEQMRKTVDEKLTDTLNQRINSSFKTVSEQLSNVYKSLGEMKELSAGVTTTVSGLNRVLSNVKTRGTWAEIQLGTLLDQTIPNMYETNVQTNPKYNGQVEFAVKIPNQENGRYIYLPVDSKFPMEDYIRLTSASEKADTEGVENARRALENRIKNEARSIKQYICQPYTTPFAIMYLATEGLYAEIMSSKNAVAEKLQQEGIMIAGPSTIAALLNSLEMGFRTIAINEKANEVWKVLGNAKSQYEKFGDLLSKAKKKVEEAGRVLDEADHRNEIIQKNLKSVETLSEMSE
ncbi:MAG: DNA recombination protein RmuC [Acetobacter sp.]|nr:DNA recombination protein RmuC [Bacteroides sp.]MCM1340185.1 DNA recombination protein RmuC [Acetobacter sp.]MCM1432863.1 DNA recombination protein RmuC [Clostridiales bacterium]